MKKFLLIWLVTMAAISIFFGTILVIGYLFEYFRVVGWILSFLTVTAMVPLLWMWAERDG